MAARKLTRKRKRHEASPPPQSISSETFGVVEALRYKLQDCAFAKESPRRRFITELSLRNIWTRELFDDFLEYHSLGLTQCQSDHLYRNGLKILSILILIQWGHWTTFKSRLLPEGEIETCRLDGDLPYGSRKAVETFGDIDGIEFLNRQYELLPIIIHDGEHCKHNEEERLPFIISSESRILSGRFGSVYMVNVAPGQYTNAENMRNEAPLPIARKILHHSVDFDFEIRNLQFFRKALTNHRSVMAYRALLTVGNEFSILYDRANMDLEEFLKHRQPGSALTIDSLLMSLADLADALHFLHVGLKIEGETYTCCHRDLKPNNILVFITSDQCVWKISDFGISSVKRNNHMTHTVDSIQGDLVMELTTAHRGSGTYLAPEAIINSGKDVGTFSDIWSFGCISIRVLARGIGGLECLQDLDNLRDKCEDGVTPYQDDYFYREPMVINPHVSSWLMRLGTLHSDVIGEEQVKKCKALLYGMLEKNGHRRLKADAVYQRLLSIRQTRSGEEYRQHGPNSSPRAPELLESNLRRAHVATEHHIHSMSRFFPRENIDESLCGSDLLKTNLKIVQALRKFLLSRSQDLFWVQETVIGRDSAFWPVTRCIIQGAYKAKVAILIHLAQYKVVESPASLALTMLYSLIYQLLQKPAERPARLGQSHLDLFDSFDDRDKSIPYAMDLLYRLLSHRKKPYLVVIDDFQSIVQENKVVAEQLLADLRKQSMVTTVPLKVILTTSGHCSLLEDCKASDNHAKMRLSEEDGQQDLGAAMQIAFAELA